MLTFVLFAYGVAERNIFVVIGGEAMRAHAPHFAPVLVCGFAAIAVFAQANHAASPAKSEQPSPPPIAAQPRTLRIAIVQMRSLDHNIDGNLERATGFAENAAVQGAKLVLYPEFMST